MTEDGFVVLSVDAVVNAFLDRLFHQLELVSVQRIVLASDAFDEVRVVHLTRLHLFIRRI